MPIAHVNGVDLYYEETGAGVPLVFSHEFGGDHRSWHSQVRYFARRYRVITYNHRGYPPSTVPKEADAYSQDILVEDLRQLLDRLGVRQAHVGGLSMGGGVALNFGLAHPDMCRSLIVAGCGSGSAAVDRDAWLARTAERASTLERDGIEALAQGMAREATRASFQRKDPRGFEEFTRGVREHSAEGCAHLLRGVMMRRPSIFALEPRLRTLRVPTLVMVGDQDAPCIEPGVFMQRTIPHAGLVVLPMSGHVINLEEPAAFNQHVAEFLAAVEAGTWTTWKS